MEFVEWHLLRLGTRATKIVGMMYGERFPMYYVTEFPKSGGNWLSRMISDYLQIPFPNKPLLPIAFKSVIHNHWSYSSRLRRVFYLYRDGRDVVVSRYFHCLRELRDQGARSWQQFGLTQPSIDDEPPTSVNYCARHLPGFVEQWVRRPRGCRISWPDHVDQWMQDRAHVVALSYEDLLSDCAGTLTQALSAQSGEPIDQERLDWTVRKFSFKKQTGRKPGHLDASAFIRKGVAGDWKNYFTRETGAVFDQLCGDTLLRLGYEQDRDWWKWLPEAAEDLAGSSTNIHPRCG